MDFEKRINEAADGAAAELARINQSVCDLDNRVPLYRTTISVLVREVKEATLYEAARIAAAYNLSDGNGDSEDIMCRSIAREILGGL